MDVSLHVKCLDGQLVFGRILPLVISPGVTSDPDYAPMGSHGHLPRSQSYVGLNVESLLSRREVSTRQDAMTYLVRVRELLSGW